MSAAISTRKSAITAGIVGLVAAGALGLLVQPPLAAADSGPRSPNGSASQISDDSSDPSLRKKRKDKDVHFSTIDPNQSG